MSQNLTNEKSALVRVMVEHRRKSLPEPMLTQIYVDRLATMSERGDNMIMYAQKM